MLRRWKPARRLSDVDRPATTATQRPEAHPEQLGFSGSDIYCALNTPLVNPNSWQALRYRFDEMRPSWGCSNAHPACPIGRIPDTAPRCMRCKSTPSARPVCKARQCLFLPAAARLVWAIKALEPSDTGQWRSDGGRICGRLKWIKRRREVRRIMSAGWRVFRAEVDNAEMYHITYQHKCTG